ncbi:MAG: hypothetical protein Q8N61_01730 [bacterium]|nr:hypothetical protein [bacterium]
MKKMEFQRKRFINFQNKNYNIFLGLILFSMIAQLLFVLRYSVDVPCGDQFDYVPLLKNLTWQNLFYQHNEHRLIIPKIFSVVLAKITHWNVRVETFFNWLFLQCSAFLLYGILKKNVSKGKAWIIAISVCFFLTPQYFDVLLWGINNCILINLLAVMSAVFIFCTVKKLWLRLHLAAISCIIASFSWGNGLFTWLALFPFVLMVDRDDKTFCLKVFLRRERLKIIYWVVAAMISTIVYFWDYHIQMSHHPPLAYPWIYPKQFLLHFFTYLGSSFLANGGNIFGKSVYPYTILGIGLCLIFILGCVFGLFNIRKNVFKLCLVIFVFLTAAAASFGRGNFPLEQALDTRYRIYSVLLPIVMIGMLIGGPGIETRLGKAISIVLISGIFIGIFLGWRLGIRNGINWYAGQQYNRKVLHSFQTATDNELERLFGYPGLRARARISILKNLKYSVFR